MYLWNIYFLEWVQISGFPLQAHGKTVRWYQKRTPNHKVSLLCPPFSRNNQSLNLFSCFLNDSVLQHPVWSLSRSQKRTESRKRATTGSSLLFSFSSASPGWSLKPRNDSPLVRLRLPLGRPWGCFSRCSSSLPLWVTYHIRLRHWTESQPRYRETLCTLSLVTHTSYREGYPTVVV